MDNKEGLGALTVMTLAGIFAIFGAASRILQSWPDYRLGAVMVGGFCANTLAGMVVGLVMWEWWGEAHPTWLIASTAVGGWTGSLVLDTLAKRWILPRLEQFSKYNK